MSERRFNPALVVAILALIVSLGGVSYAAIKIPKNSVGTKQLKRNAVSAPKLKRNAVTAPKIRRNAVTAAKLRAGSVNSEKVRDGSLTVGDFAPGQIPGETWHAERPSEPGLLPLTSATLEPVVSTPPLPPGPYVVTARANVVGGAAASTVTCSVESDAAQNFTVPAGGAFPLAMAATTVVEEERPIVLSCGKTAGTPSVGQARVIAMRVLSLNYSP